MNINLNCQPCPGAIMAPPCPAAAPLGLGQALARGVADATLQFTVAAVGGGIANFVVEPPTPGQPGLEGWRHMATGGATGLIFWAATRALADLSPFLHGVVDATSALGVTTCATMLALRYGVDFHGAPQNPIAREVWSLAALAGGVVVGIVWWGLHAIGER